MKYKIILGIIIPLLLIIVLAIVASFGEVIDKIGFVESLSVNKDITTSEGVIKNPIKIGDITLINNYSLTKRYELPNLNICLIDKEGNKQPIEAGTIEFSEGDLVNYQDIYRKNYNYESVEVKSKETRVVKIYLHPSYIFSNKNYSQLIERYGDYDSLLVYEPENSKGYNGLFYYIKPTTSCYSLTQDQIESGSKIALTF